MTPEQIESAVWRLIRHEPLGLFWADIRQGLKARTVLQVRNLVWTLVLAAAGELNRSQAWGAPTSSRHRMQVRGI